MLLQALLIVCITILVATGTEFGGMVAICLGTLLVLSIIAES